MLPLVKVTDMSFHRSSTGRLLGFGEFIMESAGRTRHCEWLTIFRIPSSFTLRYVDSSFEAPSRTSQTPATTEPTALIRQL